jgi:hypothetical protein
MLEAGTAKANAALVRESVAAVTVGDTDKPLAIVAPDILIHYAERPEPKADVGSASRTSRPARPRPWLPATAP